MHDLDLFVIGAGSGGVRAARIAAGLGAKVAMAEEYLVGGTCVVRGCIPKKLFVYAAHFGEEFKLAESFGWTAPDPAFLRKFCSISLPTRPKVLEGRGIRCGCKKS